MKMKINIYIVLALVLVFNTALFGALSTSTDVNTDSLKEDSGDINIHLEKIYDGVRTFHIFKRTIYIWDASVNTHKTLITGQNGFPIFSPRSDKDPKYTDYPIDYTNNTLKRYRPVRPPESVKSYYTSNNIALGDANTSTYHAPIVAGGSIGKGRVMVMGSHLYSSILVNPRNFSNNYRNTQSTDAVDIVDMENFFHNSLAWLTELSDTPYTKSGTAIKILSNKDTVRFWTYNRTNDSNKHAFTIHPNFNIDATANPKLVTTWTQAKQDGLIDPKIYPLLILEDIQINTAWTGYQRVPKRKTALNEVDMIIEYIREGGSVLITESPQFKEEYDITQMASHEILKEAGVSILFANNVQTVPSIPRKSNVGGVHEYDMCVLDYISNGDLETKLGMTDYTNIPTTLQGLKDVLTAQNKINYLEEVLGKRERKIFLEGNTSTPALTQSHCREVEIDGPNDTKIQIQTNLVKGDGQAQIRGEYDMYARYPVDLNFAEAQGDVGGSMNTLLAHEKDSTKKLTLVDVYREYTNMSALLINDAVFTGEKFKSLNDLMNEYKAGGKYVNASGEFYPGFSFTTNDKLDFRVKPVTRIIVERAFYDKSLKYDPSEFPGEKSSVVSDESATIYLKRNTNYQKWYAGNMQSTGLYAPAHTDITITLPSNVDEAKIQLQIGVGDNVGGIFRHEINLKRPGKYVKKYKFLVHGVKSKTITVQHPYGGLIFLKSFDSSKADSDTAVVNFTNVQKSVRFVLGKTTEAEWTALKTSAIAPKAELESNHYIVTVPLKNMSSLSFVDVTRIAQEYDAMARNAYDFYGYDTTCKDTFTEHTPPSCANSKKIAHKNREVFDPHISIGSGHSGYPIMVMSWNPASTGFPQDATNSFLLWHEMGHNMVESWLGIAGATEVANNVMAGYQQKKFNRNQKSISTAGIVLAKTEPWADGGSAGKLMMFNQLIKWVEKKHLPQLKTNNTKYYNTDGSVKSEYPFLSGDSFDVYKILHREARDRTAESDKYDVCMKQSGKTKTDMLAICTSTILGVNTKPWLQAWRAGVVGMGSSNGVNIYSRDDEITSSLDTGVTTAPSSPIESFFDN